MPWVPARWLKGAGLTQPLGISIFPYYVSLTNMSTISGNYINIHRNAMVFSLEYRNEAL